MGNGGFHWISYFLAFCWQLIFFGSLTFKKTHHFNKKKEMKFCEKSCYLGDISTQIILSVAGGVKIPFAELRKLVWKLRSVEFYQRLTLCTVP